ncbi:MAG: CAP domain-containing protein [Bacteroidales bacterium]|nr:CAP domain-containing protein [Bacteroidales bacterium]MDD4218328.1 CAP domain-containing protein [Bacteroidales bacterium]MDY0143409.1 CAP domain-containing protein [Bacteroidales bacterium]
MRNLLILLLLCTNLVSFAQLNDKEQVVFDEINRVRTNPKAYIPVIDEFLEFWDSDAEEREAANELINELRTMKPVAPLIFSPDLYKSCKKHGNYVKTTKKFIHSDCNCGENMQYGNESAVFAVCDLLIDNGVPNRQHRKNILNPEFSEFAVFYVAKINDEMEFFFVQQFK